MNKSSTNLPVDTLNIIDFKGHLNFPYRLVFSTLTGRTISISRIRSTSTLKAGLRNYEISLLRLFTAITNGSLIDCSLTGTTVLFKPGLLIGTPAGYGADVNGLLKFAIEASQVNDEQRGLSYWLIPLCYLAVFSKNPIHIVFTGGGVITSATPWDVSVDTVRTGLLPMLRLFGVQTSDIEIRCIRRFCSGSKCGDSDTSTLGGEVEVKFGRLTLIKLPKTVHFLTQGRIKRIRGVAYSVGLSITTNARVIEASRSILNNVCSDTYIYSDASRSKNVNKSRTVGVGFGLVLVGESTTGALYTADLAAPSHGGQIPEDVGKLCTYKLLDSIAQGGCVSHLTVGLFIVMMSMGSPDIGRVSLSRQLLSSTSLVQLARDLRSFGFKNWTFRDHEDTPGHVILNIVGSSPENSSRPPG